MDKYVNIESIKQELLKKSFYPAIVKDVLENIPAADVAPIRYGKWINEKDIGGFRKDYTCSECGRHIQVMFDCKNVNKTVPFCHCGAKMQLEVKEDG